MKRAFLHIGLEKTGTTTLQRTLSENRDILSRGGVFYSEVAGSKNHTNLCIYADPTERNRDLAIQWGVAPFSDFADVGTNLPTRLRREIDRFPDGNWIFSNEHLAFRVNSAEKIQRLAGALIPAFDEVRVVMFVRNQWTLIPSLYGTYIQGGGRATFDQFLKHRLQGLEYESILARWDGVFTAPPIVRLYDRKTLPNGDILDGFFSALDLPLPEGMLRIPEQNTSLGCLEVEFLRRVNERLPFFVDGKLNSLRGNLDQILASRQVGRRFTGSSRQAAAIRDSYEASNARFLSRYLTREEALVFTAPTQTDETLMTDGELSQQFIELFSYVYANKQKQIADLRRRLEQLRKKS